MYNTTHPLLSHDSYIKWGEGWDAYSRGGLLISNFVQQEGHLFKGLCVNSRMYGNITEEANLFVDNFPLKLICIIAVIYQVQSCFKADECLGYLGAFTVTSWPLDSIKLLWLAIPQHSHEPPTLCIPAPVTLS